MPEEFQPYVVDPDKRLQKALDRALKNVSDLTIPYQLMAKEWFRGNRFIFDPGRKGPGKYKDLTPRYKKAKNKKYGFIYPILRASGKLADSMIDPTNPDSVNVIVNKKTLILGTKAQSEDGAPYPIYLQAGTRKMASRPFVLLGGEQVSPPAINRRRKAWIRLLNDYIYQTTGKEIDSRFKGI